MIEHVWSDDRRVVIAVSTVADGPTPMSSQLDASPWMKNRETFFRSRGIEPRHVVAGKLVHGSNIHCATPDEGGRVISATDGLITDTRDIYLAITVADCFPVFFYDPNQQAIGIAHAGWRGVVTTIVEKLIHQMANAYQAKASDLRVGIGPGIQRCHFSVKEDVAEQFSRYPDCVRRTDGQAHVDLMEILRRQLLTAGVLPEHLVADARCSFEDKSLYSYRRDHNLEAGVMTAVIGLRPV